MKLTHSEVKKAYKISKVIQKRIDITGETNLRSTDVFPYLVKKGLFEPDRHNGIHFRRFLHKLAKNGELANLIPQCTRINPVKDETFSEWYFHDAKSKMPKPKVEKKYAIKNFIDEEMDITNAIDIIKMLMAGINPITEEELNSDDICLHPIVQEALKTIIDPESYKLEIDKLKNDLNNKLNSKKRNKQSPFEAYLNDSDVWFQKVKEEVNNWRNKRNEEKLTSYQKGVRKVHKRAFEFWTKREKEILVEGWDKCKDENKLCKILQRTSSSILLKLEALEVIKKQQSNY